MGVGDRTGRTATPTTPTAPTPPTGLPDSTSTAALLAVLALMAPAAVLHVHPPAWTAVLVFTGFAVLHLLQGALLTSHRRPVLGATWLGGAGTALATASLLVLLGADALVRTAHITPLWAVTNLGVLACSAVTASQALAAVALVGRRTDRCVTGLALVLPVVLAVQTAGLLQAAGLLDAALTGPVVAASAVLAALWVLLAGRRRTAAPTATTGSQPFADASGTAVAVVIAVTVLVADRGGRAPEAAPALALCALLIAGAHVVVLLRAVSALHSAQRAALHDDLTGLGNRRAVHERLVEQLSAGGAATLLVLDLDRFQQVNEALGQSAGDQLLREVGGRLVAAAPSRDALVARHGNDEFAVLLVGDAPPAVDGAVARVHAALAAPFVLAGNPVHVAVRTGAATAPAERAGTAGRAADRAAALVRSADAAVYAAKRADTDVVVAAEHSPREAAARLRTAEDVRAALREQQLVLHFQPQVDVRDGRLRGVEALVRWQHPERGLVAPGELLPLVAELGLQDELTRWVVQTAVHQAAAWHRAGHRVPVSVNLSPDDLRPELVGRVAGLLMAAALPASDLVLEITETSVVRDPAGAGEVLRSLVELGVRVSIDDYGTGYSSLALLLALPVTELKIDKSFVEGLGRDGRSEIVVAATVDLAHRLGMVVVAEGVETPEVLERVRALGCDTSQGYLHSRPVPAEQLLALLAPGGALDPARSAAAQPAVAATAPSNQARTASASTATAGSNAGPPA